MPQSVDRPKKQSVQLYRTDEIFIEKMLDGALTMQTLRGQIAVFAGTSVLIALSVAFSGKNSSLIIIAGLGLFLFTMLDLVLRASTERMIYTALMTSVEIVPERRQLYLRSAKAFTSISNTMSEIEEIHSYDTSKQYVMAALRRPTFAGTWLPVLSGLFIIVLGLVLITQYGWSFP